MTTVVFVHGINTHGEAYDLSFDRMRDALAQSRPDVALRPCRWGDDLGALLKGQGKSIPRYDQTKGIGERDAGPVDEADVWEMLDLDPLFELRLLALRPAPPPEDFDPRVAESPSQSLARQIRDFAGFDRVGPAPARAGLSASDLAEAHHAVAFAPEFSEAIKAAADDPEEVPPVWARAVVARAMADHPEAPLASDAGARDKLVAGLITEVTAGAQPRGLAGEWLGHALAVFGTRHALSRRGRYTRELIVPTVGDVLVYQGHGRAIRQRIRDSLPEDGPAVLLAHSLGGVSCVDLLAEAEIPQVELLITVGSQAPFFYEMDALQSLRFGQPLPPHFPRWLNLYDPRDFLSYIAQEIFARPALGTVDVPVNNRLPFPGAHSAYWTNPQTWDAIVPALPRGPER